MTARRAAAFTLLEMAVVLAIIALLIGGIMFARTLLVTSHLQTVLTDADSYITAANNFRQTYLALPGHMPNATANWGTDSNGCNNGGGATGTCSGNGDGEIGPPGYEYESFRFWQHLYYAKMLSQRLSGVASAGGVYAAAIGVNVPTGSISGSGFSAVWVPKSTNVGSVYFPGFYGNVLIFGGVSNTFLTSGPVLTADQAASLDAKSDDGMPGTGKVRTYTTVAASYAPNCATSSAYLTATYNATSSGALCSLLFITGF